MSIFKEKIEGIFFDGWHIVSERFSPLSPTLDSFLVYFIFTLNQDNEREYLGGKHFHSYEEAKSFLSVYLNEGGKKMHREVKNVR